MGKWENSDTLAARLRNAQSQPAREWRDYNGQPIIAPVNDMGTRLSEALIEKVPGAMQWAGNQFVQNLLMRGLTGNSLGDWAGYYAPRIAGAIAGSQLATSVPTLNKVIETGNRFVATPTAQRMGNGLKKAIDWIW